MARPPSREPTAAEIEILKALWESGPAELAEVLVRLRRQRPVATTTAATMLGVMRRKGLVKRTTGPRGYRWEARVTRQAAASGLLERLLDRVFEGSALRLVAHLISAERLNGAERAEILKLLSTPPQPSRKRKKGEDR